MSTQAERDLLASLPDSERRRREGRVLDDYGNEVLWPNGHAVTCYRCTWQTWGTRHNLPAHWRAEFCEFTDCPAKAHQGEKA